MTRIVRHVLSVAVVVLAANAALARAAEFMFRASVEGQHYNKQYQADQQFGRVFGIFSGLAIFIACLGLFGLSSLTAIQRTKEIGVRKVLGASVNSILTLVSKDYIILMGVAIIMATPLTWWIMSRWLQDFANRISLSWWIFALPSLLVMFIAFITVSFHTIRVARTNPTKSLRYE
jgi:putative ABC transport system permease protein